jgi:DNA (cytosine-5)-methyltransferase 1
LGYLDLGQPGLLPGLPEAGEKKGIAFGVRKFFQRGFLLTISAPRSTISQNGILAKRLVRGSSVVKSSSKHLTIRREDFLPQGTCYRVAELFCGCGGLSHGFALTDRFSVELGSDINEVFCETFRRNHHTDSGKPPLTLAGNIEKLALADLPLAFKSLGYLSNGRLDVLLGGPPCEGFSQNKRSEKKDDETGGVRYAGYNQYINDPRNFLVRRFMRVVEDLMPKVLVIENVPQILTHDNGRFGREITARLAGLGYKVRSETLIASDYGVPQARKRAFFLAAREDLVKAAGWPEFPPHPTHKDLSRNGFDALQYKPLTTVKDAIFDLPTSTESEEGGKPTRCYPRFDHLPEFAQWMRSLLSTPYNHIHRTVRESALRRLKQMKPGMRLEHLPPELRTKSWYFNCYGRLGWNDQARTITKSCNYVGSGCFGHPEIDRGITMREAARLQSFEDDFRFWSDSEHQIANMIGGAVPPLLAKAIGETIAAYLDAVNSEAARGHQQKRRHVAYS